MPDVCTPMPKSHENPQILPQPTVNTIALHALDTQFHAQTHPYHKNSSLPSRISLLYSPPFTDSPPSSPPSSPAHSQSPPAEAATCYSSSPPSQSPAAAASGAPKDSGSLPHVLRGLDRIWSSDGVGPPHMKAAGWTPNPALSDEGHGEVVVQARRRRFGACRGRFACVRGGV